VTTSTRIRVQQASGQGQNANHPRAAPEKSTARGQAWQLATAAAAGLSAAARRTVDAYAWPDLARTVLEVYKRVTGPGRDR
jgi:hypothetical protein